MEGLPVLLGLAGLLVLVVLALMFRLQGLLSVLRGSDSKKDGTMNKFNAAMFLIFGLGGIALFIWYSFSRFDVYSMPTAASEHGVRTDMLFWVTTGIISIVFIVTNLLLFAFAFKYQFKNGNKATFYPDNHILELVWTVIPALVLTYLVFNGWKEWTKITDEPLPQFTENAVELEVVGQQFYWNVRYPGKDKRLGDHSYAKIDAINAYGLKSMDSTSWDDFMPRKIYLAKGRKAHFVIRAKDVLHSVYAPQFRVKMDAMPGSPTDFWFTPTKTTQEMRSELSDPEFTYELACAEMCGKGHYSMRFEIVVLDGEDYDKWFNKASEKPWALGEAEYVWNKLVEEGAPASIKEDFKSWVKERDAELASDIFGGPKLEEVNEGGNSHEGHGMSMTDSTYVNEHGDTITVQLGDHLSIEGDSTDNSDLDEEGKSKNFIHKVGDAVENHRENKAERKGEDYEKKDNKIHHLGDKHEENKAH